MVKCWKVKRMWRESEFFRSGLFTFDCEGLQIGDHKISMINFCPTFQKSVLTCWSSHYVSSAGGKTFSLGFRLWYDKEVGSIQFNTQNLRNLNYWARNNLNSFFLLLPLFLCSLLPSFSCCFSRYRQILTTSSCSGDTSFNEATKRYLSFYSISVHSENIDRFGTETE